MPRISEEHIALIKKYAGDQDKLGLSFKKFQKEILEKVDRTNEDKVTAKVNKENESFKEENFLRDNWNGLLSVKSPVYQNRKGSFKTNYFISYLIEFTTSSKISIEWVRQRLDEIAHELLKHIKLNIELYGDALREDDKNPLAIIKENEFGRTTIGFVLRFHNSTREALGHPNIKSYKL